MQTIRCWVWKENVIIALTFTFTPLHKKLSAIAVTLQKYFSRLTQIQGWNKAGVRMNSNRMDRFKCLPICDLYISNQYICLQSSYSSVAVYAIFHFIMCTKANKGYTTINLKCVFIHTGEASHNYKFESYFSQSSLVQSWQLSMVLMEPVRSYQTLARHKIGNRI